MTKDEALNRALEALEHIDYEDSDRDFLFPYQCTMLDKAITAIKQALAAPVQEPVANSSAWWALVMGAAASVEEASWSLRDEDAKRQAIGAAKHYREAANALYATPPAAQRQWVGLTDEERDAIVLGNQQRWEIAIAIEAKLKGKNNG